MKLTRLNDLVRDDETVRGSWSLNDRHELVYKKAGLDEEIRLKSSLIAAEPNALVFAATEKQKDQKIVTSLHKLSGRWALDPKNRIVFEVERGRSRTDTLTFTGAWEIGKHCEIVYLFDRESLKTRTRDVRTLTFRGHWDITQKNRLVYSLGRSSESEFRLRGAFQTPSILAKKGEIRYQLGVEVKGRRRVREILLFGAWKLSKDLGLSFEIEYEEGRRAIRLGGEYRLGEDKEIAVSLKSREGRPLGLELILTKDFFAGDGQAFVRLQRSLEETRLEAGLRAAW